MKIEATNEKGEMLQEQSETLVFTVVDGKLSGAFALADNLRKESKEVAEKLKALGVKVFMLTGDSEEVAKSVPDEPWYR